MSSHDPDDRFGGRLTPEQLDRFFERQRREILARIAVRRRRRALTRAALPLAAALMVGALMLGVLLSPSPAPTGPADSWLFAWELPEETSMDPLAPFGDWAALDDDQTDDLFLEERDSLLPPLDEALEGESFSDAASA